jgi:hypothetical protein
MHNALPLGYLTTIVLLIIWFVFINSKTLVGIACLLASARPACRALGREAPPLAQLAPAAAAHSYLRPTCEGERRKRVDHAANLFD